MNIDRLTRLEALLRQVHRDKLAFDLTTWASKPLSTASHCGTTACALGWAALDPGFMDEGLYLAKLTYGGPGHRVAYGTPLHSIEEVTSGPWHAPFYNDALHIWTGLKAAVEFFGINFDQAEGLFLDVFYRQQNVTAWDVADRVAEIIAYPDWGKPDVGTPEDEDDEDEDEI